MNLTLVYYDAKSLEEARKVYKAFRQVNHDDPKKAEMEYAQNNPVKRLGLPHEVAKDVAFLLSEDASCVNGQTIAIDGGESNVYGTV
jgi:NAD(P)-dependent dehydrogenase (short-subunit alcohol dehydrogenase family)